MYEKEFGGLGIPNLKEVNMCLLGSWIKRYVEGDGKLWKSVIDNKYLTNSPNIFVSCSLNASTFWKGVTSVIRAIKFGYRWMVGDGAKIRFWEDTSIGIAPLVVQFWDLYLICMEKDATIQIVWDGVDLKLTFRRSLSLDDGKVV